MLSCLIPLLSLNIATADIPRAEAASVQSAPRVTLFSNVKVFNGIDARLSGPVNVLVRDNLIERISAEPIVTDRSANTTIVNGNGRTLMPGLIDAHTHMAFAVISQVALLTSDPNYLNFVAGRGAQEFLMRGFTSARDLGGNSFGLKRAIDEGVLVGPRIWPSGATISQTSGHGDYRSPWHDIPAAAGALHFSERSGHTVVADGADEVLKRTREQLMRGASHIKLMAGGGVASDFDPLDVTQYSEDEIRSAVSAADSWGTYVTVHAYTPKAIQQAIRGGVRCIEHAQLADEATMRMMRERGIWLCLQPFLDDEDAIPFPPNSPNRAKQLEMVAGTDNAYRLAKRFGVKLAFGSDTLFDAKLATRQGAQLVKLSRWFTPAEVLKIATSINGELLNLSGKRNPYPGRIGVVAEGALADLLLVDGDPTTDLKLIEDPERKFLVIMKDGTIYKNTTANP
jgi:imidazolonepropionase-like amidohydrolase